ncbi:hypothetical protein C2W62_53870, partial [Candidatus Entotheonella serta]
EFSLNDAQLSELIDAICEIETFYQRPIDIEWSYANDQLYLLHFLSTICPALGTTTIGLGSLKEELQMPVKMISL